MFAGGTQKKFWLFSGESEINKLRAEANGRYIKEYGKGKSKEEISQVFLDPSEEKLIMRQFEFILREFCKKFQPIMPKYVQGTALTYFKRFYIHNSIMDYHPRDLMLTCVYLACKVEEFNVSIGQFVGNLKGDREKFANIILGFELLLMDKLHYHLTVHNPFRPLEGFFIDIKTRHFKSSPEQSSKVEKLRAGAEEFLDKTLGTDATLIFSPSQVAYNIANNTYPDQTAPTGEDFLDKTLETDATLIFSPSQIALGAIIWSAGQESLNLDKYVTDCLLAGFPEEEINKTVLQVRRIKQLVKTQEPIKRELIGHVTRKLDACRNQENNPESEIYKRKLEEMFEDEEEERSRKRARIAQEEKEAELAVLGD